MSRKPNPLLTKFEAKLREEFRQTLADVVAAYEERIAEDERIYLEKLQIALQMGVDAGKLSANRVLGMGPGRSGPFEDEYRDTMNQMAQMLVEDSKDDADLVYSRELIDRAIKKIDGPGRFKPWDVRYNQRREPSDESTAETVPKQ